MLQIEDKVDKGELPQKWRYEVPGNPIGTLQQRRQGQKSEEECEHGRRGRDKRRHVTWEGCKVGGNPPSPIFALLYGAGVDSKAERWVKCILRKLVESETQRVLVGLRQGQCTQFRVQSEGICVWRVRVSVISETGSGQASA